MFYWAFFILYFTTEQTKVTSESSVWDKAVFDLWVQRLFGYLYGNCSSFLNSRKWDTVLWVKLYCIAGSYFWRENYVKHVEITFVSWIMFLWHSFSKKVWGTGQGIWRKDIYIAHTCVWGHFKVDHIGDLLLKMLNSYILDKNDQNLA